MDDGQAPDFSAINIQGDVKISSKVDVVMQGWQTDLFACHQDNCKAFCWSACCPCLAFTCIARIVDKGSDCACTYCCCYFLAFNFGVWWMYAGWYRRKLRGEYKLPDSPLPDCLTHLFCHWCALAQEFRELELRGFNVMKGWNGRPPPTEPAPAQTAPGVQRPMSRANN